ncbi:hypothetical protein [Coleofasciculus sp. G2-EDA-02]|uniref:hypothetical protein n=1 Tax=Coleofasciculus sp. G2-EDA-02 TaxID=3069529 RepID=UPI0033022CC1
MIPDFPEPELFTLNCPTQQILDIIADKWSVINQLLVSGLAVILPSKSSDVTSQVKNRVKLGKLAATILC